MVSKEDTSNKTWNKLSAEDQEFLDLTQHKAFNYFWEGFDPVTGLITDKTKGMRTSVATSGFGLSAFIIGIEHGWVTREDAFNRILITLNSFYDDPNDVNYPRELWGWTACAGRDGYIGFSKPYNGTLAPSAVLASLPFLPEESLESIKFMYENYGDKIWREFGFVDSFNPHQNWYDDGFLGIDKGNEVLMIENFRNGGVWRYFMENPYVIDGMNKAKFIKID